MTNSSDDGCGAVVRVLLVEDDLQVARATERLLRRHVAGLDVRFATTAEVAVLLLSFPETAGGRFDLVISDWRLAGARYGGDVLDFVRTMKSQPAFLFLSSEESLMAATGERYLVKPCRPSELCDAALQLLDPPKVVCEMPLDAGAQ